MNCLCCGKPLKNPAENRWHKNCIRRFFQTNKLPVIDISESMLEEIVRDNVNKGLTVPGVQKKLSLHLHSDHNNPRLTLVDYPTGYILKPKVEEYPYLPESEYLVMTMADACGISTVPHALIQSSGTYAYITKRIDRIIDDHHVRKFAMEDFCQLDLRLTQDKYKGSYERCAGIINRYSSRIMLDQTELFLRLVFCFVTGNSDMHLKNFSLIETTPGSGDYILSPAYDLLPVNLVMPEDTEETALTLNGKKTHLRKKDFLAFAEKAGIADKTAEKMMFSITNKESLLIDLCNDSLLPKDMKERFAELIRTRCAVFSK